MPYTSPAAVVSGTVISKTAFGDVVKADLDYLANPPHVSVRRDASFNLTNAANTTITWDVEEEDTDNMWAATPNPTRITFNTAGVYVVTASVLISSNATGYRELNFLVNGAVVFGVQSANAVNGASQGMALVRTVKASVGGYVEARIFQNSGGTLTISGGGHQWNHLAATWIGNG